MSKKTKTKNEPWAPAQPFILQGLENSGRVFDETQPQLEQYAATQRDSYGRLAPGAEQGILATQGAANNFASGAMSGMNPGASVYSRMQSANDPSMGLLSGMTGQRQTGDYSGFGQNNPAMAGLQANAGGYRPQGNYDVGANAGTAALSGMGGYNPQGNYDVGQNAGMSGLATAASGYTPQGDYSRVGQRGADGNAGAGYFRDVTAGKYLDSNPYLDSVINAATEDATNAANSQFSAAGRYGSGAHSGVLAREAGKISNAARMGAYETERARMGEAAGMLGQFDSQDRNFGLQAGQAVDAQGRDAFTSRLQGAGAYSDASAQQQALGLQAAQARDASGLSAYDSRLRSAGMLSDANARDAGLQLQGAQARDSAGLAGFNSGMAATGLLSDAYGRDQGLALNAMQAGDAARNAEFGQRMQATGLLGDAFGRQSGIQMQGAQAADQGYNADLARQMAAWGTTQDLMRGSQGLLSEAANLPWLGVGALNGNIRQASNGYGTTTSKTSGLGGYMDTYANMISAFNPGQAGG